MASGEMSEDEFVGFLSSFLGCAKANAKDGAILFVFMDWRHLYELTMAGRRNGLALAETAGLLGEEEFSASATTQPASETTIQPAAESATQPTAGTKTGIRGYRFWITEHVPETVNEYEWVCVEPMSAFYSKPEEWKQDYWKLDHNGRRRALEALRNRERCTWTEEGAKQTWD